MNQVMDLVYENDTRDPIFALLTNLIAREGLLKGLAYAVQMGLIKSYEHNEDQTQIIIETVGHIKNMNVSMEVGVGEE